jgi:hypothetical protein
MNVILNRIVFATAVALGLSACVYDPYYPYGYPAYTSPQAAYDRYWAAAVGAIRDSGMNITSEDRAAGVIQSQRGNTTMNARVITQADGRVRVEFNAGGALNEDPSLPDRVSRAYDARLGR